MKRLDLDALVPDEVEYEIKVDGKTYCLTADISTRDSIRFVRLMDQVQKEEITDEEFSENISEIMLTFFKCKHPDLTIDFFVSLKSKKLQALTAFIMREILFPKRAITGDNEGTEDFPLTQGEGVKA